MNRKWWLLLLNIFDFFLKQLYVVWSEKTIKEFIFAAASFYYRWAQWESVVAQGHKWNLGTPPRIFFSYGMACSLTFSSNNYLPSTQVKPFLVTISCLWLLSQRLSSTLPQRSHLENRLFPPERAAILATPIISDALFVILHEWTTYLRYSIKPLKLLHFPLSLW